MMSYDTAADNIDLLDEVRYHLDAAIELLQGSGTDTENEILLLVELRQMSNAEIERCQRALDKYAALDEEALNREYERSLL